MAPARRRRSGCSSGVERPPEPSFGASAGDPRVEPLLRLRPARERSIRRDRTAAPARRAPGTVASSATACSDSGTSCGRPFLVRPAGSDQIARSRSSSPQVMPATSPRRWPVSSSSLTMRPWSPSPPLATLRGSLGRQHALARALDAGRDGADHRVGVGHALADRPGVERAQRRPGPVGRDRPVLLGHHLQPGGHLAPVDLVHRPRVERLPVARPGGADAPRRSWPSAPSRRGRGRAAPRPRRSPRPSPAARAARPGGPGRGPPWPAPARAARRASSGSSVASLPRVTRRCLAPTRYCAIQTAEPPARSRRPKPGRSSSNTISSLLPGGHAQLRDRGLGELHAPPSWEAHGKQLPASR